jgi:hypothetical protein
MPTIEEVLKQSGYTDEEIAALDGRARTAFGAVLQTSQADRDAAELAQRATNDMLEKQINPALNAWGNEKANLEATNAFLTRQLEEGRKAGFLPASVPGAPDPAAGRDAGGRFVPGPSGSPVFDEGRFLTRVQSEMLTAYNSINKVENDYFRLFGEPMPDDIMTLSREAGAQRLSVSDYADRKYKMSEKRAEVSAKKQKERDDKLIADAVAADRKARAEANGGNPNLQHGQSSKFAQIRRASAEGKDGMKDPLKLTAAERQAQVRTMNQKVFEERSAGARVN